MMTFPESHASFARRHGYALVSTHRGWRVLGPRERARGRIDGPYFANEAEAWRAASRRIERALASQRRVKRIQQGPESTEKSILAPPRVGPPTCSDWI